MHLTVTVHPADIYADDHQWPLATLVDDQLVLQGFTAELGAHEGRASLEVYSPANGKPPYLTFVGRWTDGDGIRHAQQLPVEFDVNVYDFGPFRAVVTE